MNARAFFCFVVYLLIITMRVQAALLTPFISTTAENCLGRNAPGPNFCDISTDVIQQNTSGGIASVSGSYGSSAVQATLTAFGSAEADFGFLHASSSATFNISGAPGHAFGSGVASYGDVITVGYEPFTGQPGKMLFIYTLNGIAGGSGAGVGVSNVSVAVGPNLEQRWSKNYDGPVSGIFGHTFTYTYGQPFGLELFLATAAGTLVLSTDPSGNETAAVCVSCSGAGSAFAFFSDTLILSGLIIEDQNGNPISGATISSASGTVYGSNGVVPEPSTGLFVSSSFMIFFATSLLFLKFVYIC